MKAYIIVKGIILNRKLNKFLLVQRCERDAVGANTWENAGGNVECGEELEDAMRREIIEETGITDIAIERVAYVSLANITNPFLIIVYLCETSCETITLSDEHQAFIWANEEECKKILPKEILDDFVKNRIFDYIN